MPPCRLCRARGDLSNRPTLRCKGVPTMLCRPVPLAGLHQLDQGKVPLPRAVAANLRISEKLHRFLFPKEPSTFFTYFREPPTKTALYVPRASTSAADTPIHDPVQMHTSHHLVGLRLLAGGPSSDCRETPPSTLGMWIATGDVTRYGSATPVDYQPPSSAHFLPATALWRHLRPLQYSRSATARLYGPSPNSKRAPPFESKNRRSYQQPIGDDRRRCFDFGVSVSHLCSASLVGQPRLRGRSWTTRPEPVLTQQSHLAKSRE